MTGREPIWLVPAAVAAIHTDSLRQFGGRSGVRDRGLLESALARPRNKYAYGETDVRVLAAAYAFGIARNHPHVDGNKRTAFIAMLTFLLRNGWQATASEPMATAAMLDLAAGRIDEEGLTTWLRDHTVPIDD